MRRSTLSIVLVIGSFAMSFGQLKPLAGPPEVQKLIPPSPDVANLGVYGETPVSLYSGTPNISIPIYEATCGRLSLPISLTHSGKGIKVEEQASWVGLGWSLNAGGIITRVIHGKPDENGYMNELTNPPISTLIADWPGSIYWRDWTFTMGETTNQLWPDSFITKLRDLVRGDTDGEADMFYYNFGNYSGKFFYDQQNHEIVTLPQSNIIFDKQHFVSNNEWIVTTPDGAVYSFTHREENSIYSDCDGFASPVKTQITGWFLTRIEDPSTTASISLNYTDPYQYAVTNIASVTLNTGEIGSISACARPKQVCNSQSNYTTYRLTSIVFDSGKIEFVANTDRCDVVGTKALDYIKIYANNSTTPFVSYRFDYQYFNKSTMTPCSETDKTMARLKLKAIYKVSSDGHEQPPHAFTYDESQDMPSRMSYSQDAWGYYNHVNNDEYGMVPPFDHLGLHFPGSDRSVDPKYASVGTLIKIDYPTGGSTTYAYEHHKVAGVIQWSTNEYMHPRSESLYDDGNGPTFSKRIGIFDDRNSYADVDITVNNSMCYDCNALPLPPQTTCSQLQLRPEAGGTPITLKCSEKSVRIPNGFYFIEADFSGAPDQTYYEGFSIVLHWEELNLPQSGSENIQSSIGGLRIKKITDDDDRGNVKVREYEYVGGRLATGTSDYVYQLGCIGTGGEGGGYNRIINVRQSYSNNPFGSSTASTFGYAQVTERRTSGGVSNGKSVYTYSTTGQFSDDALTVYPYGEPLSFEHRRGLLLKQEDYAWKNNVYKLLRRVENEYKPLDIVFDWQDLNFDNPDPLYRETISCRAVNLDIWTNGLEPFPYPLLYKTLTEWVRQTKSTERIYDDNNNFQENITLYEYENPSHQQATKVTNSRSDGTQTISRFKYPLDYSPASSSSMGIMALRDNHYVTELIEKVVTQKIDASTENVISGALVGYNPNQLPSSVYSLRIDKPLPWTDFQQSTFSGGSFLKDEAYEKQLSFNYESARGHVIQQQKETDIPTSYIWGYDRTFPVAEVVNAEQGQIFYTSFEDADYDNLGTIGSSVTGERYFYASSFTIPTQHQPTGVNLKMTYWYYKNGQWNFKNEINYTPTISEPGATGYDEVRVYPANAMMTTYCYKPGVAISSSMDVNNRITTYEYDGFGRLVVVRDNDRKIVKTFQYHYKGE